ncbi:hypothetical protein [Clostridium beijerinckii]|uniref:hypothetical protein n=1 Tax=Clostridium beijerinckii TaxID=1520 RepID=UPI001571207D|nr:hypothetical protein [Clostridium beijerinckii]NRT73808.1 sterol desaturase/sphingolipid hydroxylase (fatty acid hydroxylase superfamily) [Clostridium beijerinckii]
MEETFSDEIKNHLIEGEKVLWIGNPNSKVIFYYMFVGISSSVICGCAEIFSIILTVNFLLSYGYIPVNYLIVIFILIVFIFFALYITILEKK